MKPRRGGKGSRGGRAAKATGTIPPVPTKLPGLTGAIHEIVAPLLPKLPGTVRPKPLTPGAVAPPVTLKAAQTDSLYRIAFTEAAGAAPAQPDQVVWVNGENELLVRTAQVRVVPRDGFVLVGIPVFTEQTGDAEVVVSFAVGRPGASLGLIMATEATPRGPPPIVERWGDQLTAAAWVALVKMTTGIAAAVGVDDQNAALLPAALVADPKGITVTPQAQHAIDLSRP
jgi:hypothetical protein